tara:strand:+ start:2551 stop:3003 length:453 start_codon:yes stop_codon:yes gene_type:complete
MDTIEFIDYRNLRTVEQIVEYGPAFTIAGLRYWIFWGRRNGLDKALVKIDTNIFIDIHAFNGWLSEGKDERCDFRDLRTLKQVLQTCGIKESKLRYWLQNAPFNGLEDAVIRKNPKKLLIDVSRFNLWLANRNRNKSYTGPRGFLPRTAQ